MDVVIGDQASAGPPSGSGGSDSGATGLSPEGAPEVHPHHEPAPLEPQLRRIPALDGVRALGIALVLVFHGGFTWAGGGFFGVDVFFVLSGFLITGLLISEFRQNNGIGLVRFWGHRVRRLVPALLAVLCGIALYAWFLAPADTLSQLRGDAVATIAYVNNWHEAWGAQGYFAALNTPRPLLHTWSLSIEEQFYVVWPLVVLGLLKWGRSLRLLLVVTVLGALASAIDMMLVFGNGSGQNRAYYGTDTRAQALLIGAALAIVLAHPLPRRRAARPPTTSLVRSFSLSQPALIALVALGGLGLVVIIGCSVATDAGTGWIYRGGFTLVALATAGLIACVALVPASPWARALSVRPVRYLGAISYGLYLWHWPIFVVLNHDRTGLSGWPLFLLRCGVSVGIAALSLRFLEMPVRRGLAKGWRAWALAPLAIGGTAALVVAATAGASAPVTALPASPTAPSGPMSTVPGGSPPSGSAQPGAVDPGTSAVVPTVAAGTVGPVRLLLVGDSEASFLGFGLGPAADAHDVAYAGDGVFGCGLTTNTTRFHGTLVNGAQGQRGGHQIVSCATQLARWQADVDAFHPDVVFLADGEYEVRDQRTSAGWSHIGSSAFDAAQVAAMTKAVGVLHSSGATVVLLTAPYYHQLEQADGTPWPEDDPARVNRYNALLRQVAAASNGAAVVADVNARLCPDGHYTTTINGVTVRFSDGVHVTAAGASMIAPWLLDLAHQHGTETRSRSGPSSTVDSTVRPSPTASP